MQSELKGKNVVIRNLGFAGDLTDKGPRSKGSMSREQYLGHIKADVIFAFFGYNESFDGVSKAPSYQKKLTNQKI